MNTSSEFIGFVRGDEVHGLSEYDPLGKTVTLLSNGKTVTRWHLIEAIENMREAIRIEEEAKAKAKLEAEALAKSQADAAAQKVIDDKARAEDEKAARLKCIQDDLDQANATNVANEAKRVAESGYQSITDEQVITSIVDEFDITFDEACNLIIRVAENMRVAA